MKVIKVVEAGLSAGFDLRRRWIRICFGLSVAAQVGMLHAAESGPVPFWSQEAEGVLELLARDTQAALRGLSAPSSAPELPATDSAVPSASLEAPVPEAVRLVAMYGLEPKLAVVLEVNGVSRRYRPGASLPLNTVDPLAEYQLLRIVDRCVVLRKGRQGRQRTVCYAPALETRDRATQVVALDSPLPQRGSR